MAPLSMDLRVRIVTVYENGEGSQAEVAKRFSVSPAVVGKLVRQYRDTGSLEPQLHRRGRKPAISGETEERLLKHLRDYPDATLHERIEKLGLGCSAKTLCQTLKRLGWRFKKSHLGQPSKAGKTWQPNARTGSTASQESSPSDLSSSTKRG